MFDNFVGDMKNIWQFIVNDWVNIVLGIAVFIMFYLLRRTLSKLFSAIGTSMFRKRPRVAKGLRESMLHPFEFLSEVAGVYIGFAVMKLSSKFMSGLSTLAVVCVIFAVTWMCANFTPYVTEILLKIDKKNPSTGSNAAGITFLANVIRVVIWCIGAIAIMSKFGLNVNALITGLGLGGLTFSLAAQSTAKNLFSGFAIISDKPFDVGDRISCGDIDGTVENITMRSTRVRTMSDTVIIVPNATLVDSAITNWSRMSKRYCKTTVGLEYGTGSSVIKKCIRDIKAFLKKSEGIDNEKYYVTFTEFADSSLNIEIIYYTTAVDYDAYLESCQEVNFGIMDIIEKNGAEFAFPSVTVYAPSKSNIVDNKNAVDV